MRKSSLVAKLLGTFTIIIGISFIITATVLSFWFQDYHFQQRKDQLDSEGKFIATAAISHLNQQKEDTLDELLGLMNFVSKSMNADILVTDYRGIVYAVTNSQDSDLIFTKLDITAMDLLQKGQPVEERNVKNKSSGRTEYIYYKPMFLGNQFSGVIIMVTPLSQIKEPLKKVYTIIWLSAILALILSSIVIYYFSEKILINPLGKINVAAKRIAKGEVENRVYINSNDEIGELAKSFNIMADSLEEVEKNRREFISNVSHELRSPITSIKGFIAGILDGIIPKDKENYYLTIAYDEIQRLARLVNDLLDLSAMEAGKLKLNISKIDVNEILKHCVINSEHKIKTKKLKVDVVLEGDNLYALGDRDRLIQVITNLIDNAIKYCNENGNLKVITKSRGSKVLVSVYNDGPGIPEIEMKYIWDRFYKSDKSRTNKISTGLGLPIVRHILNLHGEDIWVENKTVDFGVTFTFTLKKI
ncbi:two-component sensor histidine kinase [Clostridium polyendosporum]|uniref:histidine kinase n=1 Tax=Clostridium polyendosporum TaxID=69208 RepID=A0A919S2T6_9CLOT|nr:HAMP domain-containing sensor histidine kinase [Clostridium polyendosporum]GIM30193.1 two-component sensor histidine kinase [Clostridium polyendosporum]